MTTTEHPVRQLLWCALNALKTAQENHNITSETGLRHYLLEWLSGASRHPEFRSLPGEIMALKALTEKDRNIRKRLARAVLIFTERSDQLSRATDRVPGLPASPEYAQ